MPNFSLPYLLGFMVGLEQMGRMVAITPAAQGVGTAAGIEPAFADPAGRQCRAVQRGLPGRFSLLAWLAFAVLRSWVDRAAVT